MDASQRGLPAQPLARLQELTQRARGSEAAAFLSRFSEASLVSQSAALAFYALLSLAAALVGWLTYGLAFALMFHYLPDRRVGWRCAMVGGAFTASLFVLGRVVIGWYLEHSDPGAAYGGMGVLVLTLIWIYYAGLIGFIGALVTAIIDERWLRRHGGQRMSANRTANLG